MFLYVLWKEVGKYWRFYECFPETAFSFWLLFLCLSCPPFYICTILCVVTQPKQSIKKTPQIAINWKNQTNNSNTQNSPSRAKRSISNWIRSWSGSPSVYTIHKRESYGEDRDIWAEKSLGWHCYQWNGYGTMPKGQRWNACSSLEITEVTWEKLCEYFNMRKSFS